MLPTRKEITNFAINQGLTIIVIFIAGITVVLNNNNMKPENVFLVCISIFLGALAAWTIYLFSFSSNREINDLLKEYNGRIKECQIHTNNLQEYCRKIEVKDNLLELILGKQDLINIEKNVPNNTEIIVMTSKFALEKKLFKSIIIDNIRKGVMYNYLIPNDKSDTKDYLRTAIIWWESFREMFTKKEKCLELLDRSNKDEIVFSQNFIALLSRCKEFHDMQMNDQRYEETKEALKNDIFDYFKKKIQAYEINKDYSFITIIMYQKIDEISDEWDVIIKLPTSEDNEEYTAYLVPDENKNEKQKLVQSIRRFCDELQGAEKYDIFIEHKDDFKW